MVWNIKKEAETEEDRVFMELLRLRWEEKYLIATNGSDKKISDIRKRAEEIEKKLDFPDTSGFFTGLVESVVNS